MKKIITSIVAAIMMAMASGATNTQADSVEKLYPAVAIVVAVDEDTDTVTVKDNIGFTWEFKGVEDWAVGDNCNMLMSNNGTPEIIDDIILKTIYYRWRW